MTDPNMTKSGRAPLLRWRHADISYFGETVVRDVTLDVCPGEILGIVGESGSGKSTLLRAAAGLLGPAGQVSAGAVEYDGRDVTRMTPGQRRALCGPEIGMVFQDAASSFSPVRTVESQLVEAVRAHEDASKDEIRRRALALLRAMRVRDGERVLRSYPFELSGGLAQRVGIMTAMILGPRVMLADEPTSALDVTAQRQVLEEMRRVRDAAGTAVVLVTHDFRVIGRVADRVAVMKDGRVVETGTKEEVLRRPRHPYTKRLLASVIRITGREEDPGEDR